MSEPIFLRQSVGLTLDEIASLTGAPIATRSPRTDRIMNIAPLDRAGPRDLTFLESRNFAAAAATTHAGACLTTAALAKELPNNVSVLTTREPYRAFYRVLLLTGVRLREASDARWSEFDLDQRTCILESLHPALYLRLRSRLENPVRERSPS